MHNNNCLSSLKRIESLDFNCEHCNVLINVIADSLKDEKFIFTKCPICGNNLGDSMQLFSKYVIKYNEFIDNFKMLNVEPTRYNINLK